MNLAYYYPIIFWNTANLIVDSGGEFVLEDEDIVVDEIEDVEEEEVDSISSNYGKIASAIGRMQQEGIEVLPPNINKSNLIFTPVAEENHILFGLTGISRVGAKVVKNILNLRPFTSVEDVLTRLKPNKTQMVSLIKSGALDGFGNRFDIMKDYINSISETKKTVNLRNVRMLMENELFSDSLSHNLKVFNFNKYIRKGYDKSGWLKIDDIAMRFYEENYDIDELNITDSGEVTLHEPSWKAKYDSAMNPVRSYIKANHDELLEKLNNNIISQTWEKYALGNEQKWSMDAVNFYQKGHELDGANLAEWGIEDYWMLPEEPQVKSSFYSDKGNLIQLYELTRIAGTVIDKDIKKSQITLLTTGGVVVVQAYGVAQAYDKQVRQVQANGKSKIVEYSWFKRGTKLIVTGMRRGRYGFVAKKYKNTKGHHFMKITEVLEDGTLVVQEERTKIEEA